MKALKWGALRVPLATAALAVAYMAIAPSAPAHETRVGHPSDGSWTVVQHDRHNWIAVCDGSPDGHLAYSRYELLYDSTSWKPEYRLTGYDDYGNDGQGQFCHWEGHWSVFRDIAICVQHEGCSGWATVYQYG